jgi:glycosyltransferase involved in cell wall biosynthesis
MLSSRSGVLQTVKSVFFTSTDPRAAMWHPRFVYTEDPQAVEQTRQALLGEEPPWLLFNGMHSLWQPASLQLLELNQQARTPQIVYWHETAFHMREFALGPSDSSADRRRRCRLCRDLVRSLSNDWTYHLTANSDGKQLVMLLFGCDHEKVAVANEAIALERYTLAARACKGVVRVCGAGLLDQRKGIDLFARISQELRDWHDMPFQYTWYGGERGDLHRTVRSQAMDAIRSQAMTLAGYADPLTEKLPGHDVFLLTSRDDPFPIVALEALASDLPVFAFESAGTARILPDAFVCQDASDMIDKLRTYMDHRSMYPPGFFAQIVQRFGRDSFWQRWDLLARRIGRGEEAQAPPLAGDADALMPGGEGI